MWSTTGLASTGHIAGDLESHLGAAGQIFARFFQQDSGCRAYGVEVEGGRYFVKASVEKRAVPSLHRTEVLHRSVTHEAIIPLLDSVTTDDGLALIYPWVEGEVLYGAPVGGAAARLDSASARPVRSLPTSEILAAVESIFDTHLAVTDAGFVAPEEFQRGAVIDECNTVFNLGRAALVLLDEGDLDGRFRGTGAASDVLDRATHPPTPRREVCDRRRVRLSMARGAPRMSTEPVLVVPYDPQWASIFEELEARLRSSLEDVARRIDHIGSTAVSLSVQPVEYSPWWRLG